MKKSEVLVLEHGIIAEKDGSYTACIVLKGLETEDQADIASLVLFNCIQEDMKKEGVYRFLLKTNYIKGEL